MLLLSKMQGSGIVKSVLSGDTVILVGKATHGIAPEIQLSLAFCQAPRVAYSANGAEEPFGWQSREYLRKMLIGKTVQYRVLYKVDAISRSFATFNLNEKDVVCDVVEQGMVSVRSERDDKGNKALYEKLLELQASARSNHKGIWGDHRFLRNVNWTLSDPESFFYANKSLPLVGVVEQVRDGSTLRLYLPETSDMMLLHLAGVQCPRITYSADGEATYEAFSQEARSFTELRLLNRSVVFYLDGMDKFTNFYGHVYHPCGDVASELLQEGLARVQDWSARFLPVELAATLRQSESRAKSENIRLWTDWHPTTIHYEPIEGRVFQVLSGDTLLVQLNDRSPQYLGSQRRLNLASIRAPKLGNARKGVSDEPMAVEAKEALIEMCIGKKVRVTVDYDRQAPAGMEPSVLTFCTVEIEGKQPVNLGLEMVRKGLARVMQHRQDDPRASNYDELLQAEEAARRGKRGVHNPDCRATRRVDYSQDRTTAMTSLHFIKNKRLTGYIDYVFSASHFSVCIPAENCQFSLSLQGVKAPQNSGKGEPAVFGDESLLYTRSFFLQRRVEVEVLNVDKVGNYIGRVYLPREKEDLAYRLLREGAVFLNEKSLPFCRDRDEMEDIQEEAKRNRRGCWREWKEPVPEVDQAVSGEMDCNVTFVLTGNVFFVNAASDRALLKRVETALEELPIPNSTPVLRPREGTVYAYLERNQWFRVKVESVNGEKVSGHALDRGNPVETTCASLHEIKREIGQLPPLARECVLAGVDVPKSGDWSVESRDCLRDLADCDHYKARVVLRDAKNRLVTFLYREGDEEVSVNEMMLSEGWGRLEKGAEARFAAYPKVLRSMMNYQEDAKEDRVGIYQYGDIGFKEDEE